MLRWKQISKYGLEAFLAVSAIWVVVQKFDTVTKSLGFAMFLGGIVFSIYKVRTSVEQLVSDSATIQERLTELGHEVDVLQGESHFRQFAEAAREIDQHKEPHLYAGHNITARVYDHAARLMRGLRQLQRRESNEFRVEEQYVINDFLAMLAEALPAPSIWFGVTHLTTGWEDQDADPGFVQFRKAIRRRSKAGELRVLRVYCANNEHTPALKQHFNGETAAGIQVVALDGDDLPPDLSLLYSLPEDAPMPIFDRATEPSNVMTDATAICALEFRTRSGRSLDGIYFYTPSSDNFRRLQNQFDRAWLRGATMSVD
jgi:hypothetical protein